MRREQRADQRRHGGGRRGAESRRDVELRRFEPDQQVARRLALPRHGQQPGGRQSQVHLRPDLIRGEAVQPSPRGQRPTRGETRPPRGGHQMAGLLDQAGAQQVVQRLVYLVPRREPLRRFAMQLGQEAGLPSLELRLQELPEEVVVAVPLAMVVERDEEEVLPLDRLEQDCAVLAVRQHGAELRAQARHDRRAREEPDGVGGLIGQHLGGQVVRDLATLTRGQGPRPVTRLPRERGEVHARRPALRRELQRLDLGALRLEPVEGQKSGRALPIEAESREAILGEQIPRTQAPKVQRRIGSAAGDDGRTHGHGLDQHAQDLPAARVTDEVGVVQHQDEGGRGRHRLDQRRKDGLPDRRIGQGEPHQDLRDREG